MSKIHIIQHGKDGIGHQLYGLLSCLGLHGVKNYYFDGDFFINKKLDTFSFLMGKHKDIVGYDDEAVNNLKKYFIEIGKGFIKQHSQKKIKYKNVIHSHEIYNIPINSNPNTLYSLDNAYYFNKIPINDIEKLEYVNNIKKNKVLFINNGLPKNRLQHKNIVIHLRQGDAAAGPRGKEIKIFSKQLIELVNIFMKKYEGYTYHLHTDGDATFITNILKKNNIDYKLFTQNEKILNVLSDFIHSNIFVASPSALSIVCTFLGDHKLTIIPDNISVSVPENAINIAKYIKENHKILQ